MSVAVEGYGWVFVPKDLGERLHIHAAFEGACSERMPQRMETFVRNFQFFQEQFKTALVGADGNAISVA